jgi:DNA-binding beta-propeller fold protein YncE
MIIVWVSLAISASGVLGDWVYLREWGKAGAGDGEFNSPAGVDVAPNGNVYVCDVLNHRVQYFTWSGSYLGKWGSFGTGNGQFNEPYGVAVMQDDDKVYVADTLNHRIQCFTRTGSFLFKWGTKGSSNGQFNSPYDVAYGMPFRSVYVADSMNHRVQFFRTTGSYKGKWSDRVTLPMGIAVRERVGSVYSSDGDRILRFTPTGSYVGQWSIPQGSPTGLGFMPDGLELFVACKSLHQCRHFKPAGSLVCSWGSRGSGKGEFRRPWDVAVSPDRPIVVYVSEAGGNRVQIFRWSEPAVSPASLGRVKALFR